MQCLNKKILYVPLDNRPVNASFVEKVGQAICPDFVMLPDEFMQHGLYGKADIEGAWSWLKENKADIAIVSADTLIYGGLVPARRHDLSEEELQKRLAYFYELKKAQPNLKIYAMVTVLRSPKFVSPGTEPDYYVEYGPQIFQATSLMAQKELDSLSPEDEDILNDLTASIPQEYLTDFLGRRKKNFAVNQALIKMAEENIIEQIILGRDDTSQFTFSTLEYKELRKQAKNLLDADAPQKSRFHTFCGLDDLGLVFLARVANENKELSVFPIYSPGKGGDTIPSYEDSTAKANTELHISASGATVAPTSARSDMILLVNTPFDGITREANAKENQTASSAPFLAEIKEACASSKIIALADISYANGSDNALLKALRDENLLYRLDSYAGWNTAGNTLGFAIAIGLLHDYLSKEMRDELLTIRYLDEWAFQANWKHFLINEILPGLDIDNNNLDSKEDFKVLMQKTDEFLHQFQKENGIKMLDFQSSYPWNRLFEIAIDFRYKFVAKTHDSKNPTGLSVGVVSKYHY